MIGLIIATCMSVHHCTYAVHSHHKTIAECEKKAIMVQLKPNQAAICDELK